MSGRCDAVPIRNPRIGKASYYIEPASAGDVAVHALNDTAELGRPNSVRTA